MLIPWRRRPRPDALAGSVVVVTGASSGIGRAAALAFAGYGADLALVARGSLALEELADECRSRGARAMACPADVADAGQVAEAAARAVAAFGRIDVWVNNAAVMAVGEFLQIPDEAFRRVMEVNVIGYVNGARAALSRFVAQGHGVLVNTSSLLGSMAAPGMSPYVTSKFAVEGLAESLRHELVSDRSIHVCNVLPGGVNTPLYGRVANYSGRAVNPAYPLVAPEAVADAIVRCAVRPVRQVRVGGTSRVLHAVHSLSPRLYERLGGVFGESLAFLDEPTEPTSGNLFQSLPPAAVAGRWRHRRERPVRRLLRPILGRTALLAAALAVRSVGPERPWRSPTTLATGGRRG